MAEDRFVLRPMQLADISVTDKKKRRQFQAITFTFPVLIAAGVCKA
jgi:hypothetical protein